MAPHAMQTQLIDLPDPTALHRLTGSGTQFAFLWHTDVNTSVLSSTSDSVHQNVAFDPSNMEL